MWIVDADHCHSREDAISGIVANQLGRRNLTPSQKAALAVEIDKQLAVEAKKHQRQGRTILSYPAEQGQARDQAAAMLGINPHYITDAEHIEQDAPVQYS